MTRFPSTRQEFNVFRKIKNPAQVQDFLNSFGMNFETSGETCRSPLLVLRKRQAHCMEGALLAAAIFWYHGQKPLLLDLQTSKPDVDHVVTLFKEGGRWGAVSKTNHGVLRYREPIFKTVRELALSYFHEYFLDDGRKTMRSYSAPFSLLDYEDDWLFSDQNLWAIPDDLDTSKHFPILQKNQEKKLRKAERVEIESGKLTEWTKDNVRRKY
ncbi:MAG: hypothetical protein AAB903_03975 [Patescibacteria group bacterium]